MERDAQRYAGNIVAQAIQRVKELIIGGERNTLILNDVAEEFMFQNNVIPACKGYRPSFHPLPYQYGTCLSINHEIVHGIPDKDKILKDGDIVGIDIVGLHDGWHADAAITVAVGSISSKAKHLLKWTEQALYCGINQVKSGAKTGDIGFAIQKYARKHGLGIADSISGHGIGKEIHCAPAVPNVGKPHTGTALESGTSICIEPMLMLGSDRTSLSKDGWCVMTQDNTLAAHFEHTILIKEDGTPEILTKL